MAKRMDASLLVGMNMEINIWKRPDGIRECQKRWRTETQKAKKKETQKQDAWMDGLAMTD